jgi:F420H(2)-dependent quinone reductase
MSSKPPPAFPPPGTVKATRMATAEEKARCWPRLVAGYPFYNDYQARTAREIPVILLSHEGQA